MANVSRLGSSLRHASRAPEILRCISAAPGWWNLTAAYVGLRAMALPTETVLRDGTRFRLEEFYDLETLWQIYFHRVYDVRRSDRAVVDVGANIGLFSCYAASKHPQLRVFAVEPFPSTHARLVENIRRNGLQDRIEAHCVALSGVAGEVVMASAGEASQMFHVVPAGAPVSTASIRVPSQTLGGFLAGLPIRKIDLLKVDIEGSEYELFKAVSRDQLAGVSRLNIEYHEPPPGHSKQELISQLEACGFVLTGPPCDGPYGVLYCEQRATKMTSG